MQTVSQIGKYAVISSYPPRPSSQSYQVLDKEKQVSYFCKTIHGLQPSEGAQQTFKDIARKLSRLNSPQINAPVDSGFDQELGQFYIIYPLLENNQTLKQHIPVEAVDLKRNLLRIIQCWRLLIQALSEAQSKRIFHKDIHPENILIVDDNQPVLIDFGLVDMTKTLSKSVFELQHAIAYTSPEILTRQEDPIEIRADIYSLALCMLEYLIGSDAFSHSENNAKRLEQLGQTLVEITPLCPIKDLLDTFEACLAADPQLRFGKYSDILVRLSTFQEHLLIDKTNPAAVLVGEAPSFPIAIFFEELNASGAHILIEEEKYKDEKRPNSKAQVRFRMATESFFAPRCYVEGNTLKVMYIKQKGELDGSNNKSFCFVKKRGEKLNFSFQQIRQITHKKEGWIDVEAYFEHLFEENTGLSSSVKLTDRQKEILNFYDRLLAGELALLEKNAFSIKYAEYQQQGSDYHFKVMVPEGKTWRYVHDFIQKSTDNRNDEVELIEAHTLGSNRKPFSIGKAVRFDEPNKVLVLRDAAENIQEIPPRNGELREDVSKQKVQFERQRKAIRAFRVGEFFNKDLCAYLFNPETLPQELPLLPEMEGVLSLSDSGKPLSLYDAQERAVRKILHNPPITLVQGPPGTGKTTVIVEAIHQIIRRDPLSKILVTSQSNFAVDNVLQKLAKVNVPIIRLGKPNKIKQPQVKQFALDKSLRTWAERTTQKHIKYFKQLKDNSPSLRLSPGLIAIKDFLKGKGEWQTVIRPKIELYLDTMEKYASLRPHLNDRASFQIALEEFAMLQTKEPAFVELDKISKDWTRLLNNLNDKSDLVVKMVDSVNVIGATSNHIASGAYSKFEFDFDYVIMDEAAKATPAESLVPISMGRNIVLVGDHLQLQPIVSTNKELLADLSFQFREEMLDNSQQTYLGDDYPSLFELMYDGVPDDYKEALNIQRRMPGEISDLISKHFYEIEPHKLRLDTPPERRSKRTSIGPITSPLVLLDTGIGHSHSPEKKGYSLTNPYNADLILELLTELDKLPDIGKKSIGVISGYGAQTRLIHGKVRTGIKEKRLKHLQIQDDIEGSDVGMAIATVDSFQGLEKDIIIFDLVRSEKGKHLGFLEIPNRINVALSRVKDLLIIVGDIQGFIHAPRMGANKDKDKAPIQKLLAEIDNMNLTLKSVKEVFNG